MIPDIEVQLQSIIKSLKDNVLPAIDQNNQLAQQQIQLSLATLEITLGHLPLVHRVVRADLQENVSLAKKLCELIDDEEIANSLQEIVEKSALALEDPGSGFIQLQQHARELRSAIGMAIAAEPGATRVQAVEQLIMETSPTLLNLGRAWNKPMGFEPAPDEVIELAKLFENS